MPEAKWDGSKLQSKPQGTGHPVFLISAELHTAIAEQEVVGEGQMGSRFENSPGKVASSGPPLLASWVLSVHVPTGLWGRQRWQHIS